MSKVYQPPKGKGTLVGGIVLGIVVSALLFLAIPLTQIFTEYEKETQKVERLEVAEPPPPPPPEDPPDPPEPEEEDPPPEMDQPPPDISLEQLEMSLNPGTGGGMGGDFEMPSFDVEEEDLGSMDAFELDEVDSEPRPRSRIRFRYPASAKRRGITGVVKLEYIVNEDGEVEEVSIIESPAPVLSEATAEVIRRTNFEPATKNGRPVKVRMTASVPYN